MRDTSLPELLLRLRARNVPDTRIPDEDRHWNDYRRQRLKVDSGLSELTFAQSREQIAQLRAAHVGDGSKQVLLDALESWHQQIEASLG